MVRIMASGAFIEKNGRDGSVPAYKYEFLLEPFKRYVIHVAFRSLA